MNAAAAFFLLNSSRSFGRSGYSLPPPPREPSPAELKLELTREVSGVASRYNAARAAVERNLTQLQESLLSDPLCKAVREFLRATDQMLFVGKSFFAYRDGEPRISQLVVRADGIGLAWGQERGGYFSSPLVRDEGAVAPPRVEDLLMGEVALSEIIDEIARAGRKIARLSPPRSLVTSTD